MATKTETIKHKFLYPHKKLSETEKNKLLSKYNVTESELPKISSKDPAVINLGVEEGDVVKIERPSTTAGSATFYRTVIKR